MQYGHGASPDNLIGSFYSTSLNIPCNELKCRSAKRKCRKDKLQISFDIRTTKQEHITPVFLSLKKLAPPYIADFLHAHTPMRYLRSAGQVLLTIPPSRLKSKGGCAFAVIGPKFWH